MRPTVSFWFRCRRAFPPAALALLVILSAIPAVAHVTVFGPKTFAASPGAPDIADVSFTLSARATSRPVLLTRCSSRMATRLVRTASAALPSC